MIMIWCCVVNPGTAVCCTMRKSLLTSVNIPPLLDVEQDYRGKAVCESGNKMVSDGFNQVSVRTVTWDAGMKLSLSSDALWGIRELILKHKSFKNISGSQSQMNGTGYCRADSFFNRFTSCSAFRLTLIIFGVRFPKTSKPFNVFALLIAVWNCPAWYVPLHATTILSLVQPCALWMVPAHDRASGNCTRLPEIFEDLPTQTGTSTVGTGVDYFCRGGISPLEAVRNSFPTAGSWNFTNTYFGLYDSVGYSPQSGRKPVTIPAAVFTKPSEMFMFLVRITFAPTAKVRVFRRPEVFSPKEVSRIPVCWSLFVSWAAIVICGPGRSCKRPMLWESTYLLNGYICKAAWKSSPVSVVCLEHSTWRSSQVCSPTHTLFRS